MKDVYKTEKIASYQDFLEFLRLFREFYRTDGESWENNNLCNFLSGLEGFVMDRDGWYLNQGQETPDAPDWKYIADILMAATMYE